MKKNWTKAIFNGWFWAWLVVAAGLVVAMVINGHNESVRNWLAGFTMALFMVLPVRYWAEHVLVWAIEYTASRKTEFKNRINKYLTYNRILDNRREDNPGFYFGIHYGILVLSIVLALACLVFRGASFNVVYAWLHTMEFLFRGWLSPVALLIYVLGSIGFYFLSWKEIGWIKNEVCYDDSGNFLMMQALIRGGGWLVAFYAKIIVGGILLKNTWAMIGNSVLLWSILFWLPFIAFEVWNHWPENTNTP